ncbi:MAG: hypothetical protein AB7D27_09635 [Desulfomicrobium sp.]
MKLLICMDDTDNMESKGTGWLVEDACREMAAMGWGTYSMISRHQLFVHPDIPYTSHNSSMVFTAETDVPGERYVDFLSAYLEKNSAPGSDPGLCIAHEPANGVREVLISFGLRAKKEVLTKDEAYALAHTLGVHLSEHGGTGGGIIGALAGIGLRLWGNDGRFRGWYHLGRAGSIMTAGELRSYETIEDIRTPDNAPIEDTKRICISDQLKTICMNGRSTLLVHPAGGDGVHLVLAKEELKRY